MQSKHKASESESAEDSGSIAGSSLALLDGGASTSTASSRTTILGDRIPKYPSDKDSKPVELGMKFQATAPARILGVRFYKGGTSNAGIHVGKLYTRTGALLASVTFASETASGWQSALFSAPVEIQADTTYVVSYYAPKGHYANDNSAFISSIADPTGLLKALANGADGGNGVYRYGGGFPTSSYKSTNYYVDVIAEAAVSAPVPSPSVAPSAAPTATPTPTPIATTEGGSTNLLGLAFNADAGTITAPFALSGGAISQGTESLAIDSTSGSAVFHFNVPADGQYVLKASVNAPSDSSNSFFVNIDAQPVSPTMIWDASVTQGFEMRTISWRGAGTPDANEFQPKVFTLSKGAHDLIIRGREARAQIASLEFALASQSDVPTTTPPPSTPINIAPQVSLASSASSGLIAPASLTLSASASDSDGTITKVEFFQGSTKLGEDLSAPYSLPVSGLAAGIYTFKAKATDDDGAVTTSSDLMITVSSAPATGGTAGTGRSFYVTQNGAGAKDGSSLSNAWPVATFNASTAPKAGDTVFFSGTITSTVAPSVSGSGNGASRITLDFSGATLNDANPRIQIAAKRFLNLIGGTFGNDTNGALISFATQQSNDITIKGWRFTGSTEGVSDFLEGYYAYNVLVEDNYADNIAHFYMSDSILTHDLLIKNNFMRSSVNTTSQTDMIFIGDAYNVTIEGNKIVMRAPGATVMRHNDCIQTYMKGGSNAGNPHDWIVRYNWIEQNIAPGTSGDNSWMMMAYMQGEALKIYGNVFFGNDTASRNGNNGVHVSLGVSGGRYYFYNNTVITKALPTNQVRFLDAGTAYIRNNIGMADADETGTFLSWTMAEGGGSTGWDYNFWYQFDNATSDHSGTHGSTTTNPMFTNYAGNDFSLSASSPLRKAGDPSIGSEYSYGIAPGSSWPNPTVIPRTNWSAGAFEAE